MCLTLSPCVEFCLDSNVKLFNFLVVDISTCVWSVPPPLLIFVVFCLGINICTYYIINVLYINSWLTLSSFTNIHTGLFIQQTSHVSDSVALRGKAVPHKRILLLIIIRTSRQGIVQIDSK